MNNIFVEVQVYPAMDIHSVARDACKFSDKMLIPVRFNFNGIFLFAYPGHSVQIEDRAIDIVNEYERKAEHVTENS